MSKSKSLFLDTNVLYNLIQNKPNADDLLNNLEAFDFTYILSLSEFFAYNFCVFTKANTGKDYFDDLQAILENKRQRPISIDLSSKILANAKQILKDKDFEDACQVSAAIASGCDAILTSDEGIAHNYKHLIKIIFVPKK
jgi:predicted nucleic acid-binding protein